jgi:hypothetical protein
VTAEFSPTLSRVKGWDGDPFPSSEDVERVMVTLTPRIFAEKQRLFVIDVLRLIRYCRVTHPGAEKRQLRKAAEALEKARAALTALPVPHPATHNLVCELARVRDSCKRRAGSMEVKRSGGRLVEAAQKKIAAEMAMNMLLFCGEKPTLSREGAYFKLAALLFEVATGKPGDLERACAKCCAEAAADGYQTPQRQRKNPWKFTP